MTASRRDATSAAATDGSGSTIAVVAGALALADLVSKEIAVARLSGGGELPLGGVLRLVLAYNDEMAGGMQTGGRAFELTLVATLLLLVCIAAIRRPLAAVDPGAPRMLGLVVGAALGNALSLLAYPAGAPDFIAVDWGAGSETLFNVADLGLFVGLALCGRSVWRIGAALREERTVGRRPALALAERAPAMRPRTIEREVPLAMALERPALPLDPTPPRVVDDRLPRNEERARG